jgi:cleavage stimulation factor subunit 3
MKFARRAEGIKAARTVFKMAREDARSRYHVFISAAMMEYYSTKVTLSTLINLSTSHSLSQQDKTVAFKIFELGLKKYGDQPEYILAYVNYMSHINGKNTKLFISFGF